MFDALFSSAEDQVFYLLGADGSVQNIVTRVNFLPVMAAFLFCIGLWFVSDIFVIFISKWRSLHVRGKFK